MNITGLDIGGANLKAADREGQYIEWPFALWQNPDRLSDALASILARFGNQGPLAITMTGELADCFVSKREGVEAIVSAATSVAGDRRVGFYQTTGRFVPAPQAVDEWQLTAASNWHALATYCGRLFDGRNVLVDFGSTTCDIIPIIDGRPAATGSTDVTRIMHHELVYTGCCRSPIAAVLPAVQLDDTPVPLAHEVFATMLDAYLVLERVDDNEDMTCTADGRPATKEHASHRLSRMLCSDEHELPAGTVGTMAQQAEAAQRALILNAIRRIVHRLEGLVDRVILAGQGEPHMARWIAEESLIDETTSLSSVLGDGPSRCAPAFALAHLDAAHDYFRSH